MPKQSFVDFKAIKAAITMEQVLEHYGLIDQFKRGTDSLSGPCPIHKGSNPTQFRVSISKNVWNCFSECKHGGNVLDFITRMENVTVHAAALKAIQWFHLDPESMSGSSGDAEPSGEVAKPNGHASPPRPASQKPVNGGRKVRRGHWDDMALEKCGTSLVEKEGCTPTWKSGVRFAEGC